MSKQIKKVEETAIIERPLEVIAIEIRSIDTQTREFVLRSAIDIGKRLTEAKSLVAHGEWGNWLETNVPYSQSSANNFMRVSDEYANSQTLANLSYSQAIALLAIPSDERESFAEENKVEDMSTRELQAAIKEKQELERQLQESQEREEAERVAREALAASVKEFEEKQKFHEEQVAKLNADLEVAQEAKDPKTVEKVKEQLRQAKNDLSEQRIRVKDLEDELKKQPIDVPATTTIEVIPEETKQELESLRQREQELAEQITQNENEAAKQIEEMKQMLEKNNNTAAIKVKVCFDTLVGNFKDLLTAISEVQNKEEQEKFQGAISKLCDKMKEQV